MSTTCEYSPVQSTRRNSPDLEGRAEDMLGKYAISCFGGPGDMVASLARRSAEWVKVVVVVVVVDIGRSCLDECLRMVRGRAVLSIVGVLGSISFEGLRFVQGNDVFDGIRSSACERHVYRFVRLFPLHLCVNRATHQARTSLNRVFIHPVVHMAL